MRRRTVKVKTEKTVEKIDAILDDFFSTLPPADREQVERAFIDSVKKLDIRALAPSPVLAYYVKFGGMVPGNGTSAGAMS